jgi:hypothetical protein
MKSLWRSLRPLYYRSRVSCASRTREGVTFTVRRISLGGRIELAQSIRNLAQELEFQQAGASANEQVAAAAIAARINLKYLEWGLCEIRGLLVDGEAATPQTLFASGPEDLTHEIVDRIKAECGLSGAERKN